ncbi:MAG TPA: OmpH family outer membrane protein [Burkholderiales bacterium]|jgi:outer membrane protein|nr:OmpH family outer membrane protein [Burkholderiales bacterium]
MLLAAAMVLAAASAYPQEPKIGYVNLARLERESVPGQKAIAALKREFAPREQEIVDLQKQIKEERARFEAEKGTLSESALAEKWKPIAEMMKKSDRMVYAMQEDMRLRRREIMVDFVREINAAVLAVSKAKNLDLVLQEAVFNSKRIDITDQVLAEMAKRSGASGR